MTKQTKKPTRTRRYTILFDANVYLSGKLASKDAGLKMFEYLNHLISVNTGTPITADLKHRTNKSLGIN